MRKEDIQKGDVLVSTDKHGSGWYKVLKVNRVTVEVKTEQGARMKIYPHIFDRKDPNPPHIAAFD